MPKPILKCDRCGNEWPSEAKGERVTCSHCQYKTTRNVVGHQTLIRGKGVYDGCDSIAEMIDAIEQEAEFLKSLQADGFEVPAGESIRDDYAYLEKRDE